MVPNLSPLCLSLFFWVNVYLSGARLFVVQSLKLALLLGLGLIGFWITALVQTNIEGFVQQSSEIHMNLS